MVTRKEANVEWDNVLANQFYNDVFGVQWEPDENGYWESNETGEFISPEKMRLKVWEETCGVPAGVATGARPKYYVSWEHNIPEILMWDDTLDEEPLTLAEAKKEAIEHYQSEIQWSRDRIKDIKNTRAKDFKESNE